MNVNVLLIIIFFLSLGSCTRSSHSHDADDTHDHETEESQGHEEPEEPKFQYTAYSENFEVFAEADPFVAGKPANILAHFTWLPGFEPLVSGRVTARVNVGTGETFHALDAPTRKGIYSFEVQPEAAGTGSLIFVIENEKGTFEILVPDITVFSGYPEAREAAGKISLPATNTTVFTKEQSWKIDFATQLPEVKPFGQVIKATALIKPAAGSERVVAAKTGGLVKIASQTILEGEEVKAGEKLFTISGSSLAENNLSVRYAEAKNNFEKAQADYDRMKVLAEERIVSQRDLLEASNEFENAKAMFDNLKSNFTAAGQTVSSPMNGFIRQVHVENGAYVEAGQPVLTISQNKSLLLTADVAPRYASALGGVVTANIRNTISGITYTLEELNGKILSYGKAAGTNHFLVPVNLEIGNQGDFFPGNFVEVYLKTLSGSNGVIVPGTSLLEEQGNYFVWVQITPELFEKRLVTVGETDGLNIRIEKGLSPAERVVSKGAVMIKLAQSTGALDAHSGHVH